MTSMLKPVLALCLVGFFSYSSAQEVTSTGNLINNGGWSGATYGADPGGCCASISGSGALYDTNTDTIMFSYGLDTLVQTVGLQQALGGTGVQVHGYNYSLDYRLMPNSVTHTDNLTASIWLTTSSGFNTEATHLFLSGQVSSGVNDQWNTISGTRNFELPYTDPQSVTMRLEGRDGGFWAGYYGPEVRNVSLSVNYSFDPCASDPLYASTCPGYWQAFQERYGTVLAAPEPVISANIAATDTAATNSDVMMMPAPVASASTNSGASESQPSAVAAQPSGAAEASNDSERSTTTTNLSGILANIRGIENELAGIAQRTVDQSVSDSAQAGQESAQTSITEAEATAESSQTASDTSGSNVDSGGTALGTGITAVTGDAQFTAPGVTAGTTFDLGRALTQSRNQSLWSGNHSPDTDTVTDTETRESVMSQASTSEVDQAPNLDTTPNMIGLGIDAVQSARDSSVRGTVPVPGVAPSTQMRNRPAPSELAGGADMAQLVQTPTGFDAYTTSILPDTQFYAARDIYAGQRTVDNVRALRQLASDRLHQEMVSQQYGGR